MAIDANVADRPDGRRYDVCVVGAGAAGITLALKLSEHGRRVALCEAGSFEYSAESQDCYAGEVIGDPYFELDAARLRFFGGSTNHWGGWCGELDAIDFDRSDVAEAAIWPISKADLDPYLERACRMLEIGRPDPNVVLDPAHQIQKIDVRFSPPVRFGTKYRDEVARSRNIDLYINANLSKLNPSSRRIVSAEFHGYSGNRIEIPAASFVLATGGIENSRQLLWQHQLNGAELYDADLPVGQYWMEHPHYTLGEALVPNELSFGRFYGLTAEAQRELGIFNCGLRVEEQGRSATKRLVKDLLCVAPRIGGWAAELAERNLICGASLRAAWEQAPVASNRVRLSDRQTDRFGIPLTELWWTKTEIDRKTVELSARRFALWLLDDDLGRIRFADWFATGEPYPADDEIAGHHHMGGTRMSSTARCGVVDAQSKVFGTQNLYVAGSSVFATAGKNNPTLPIVQLALRLAQHLSRSA